MSGVLEFLKVVMKENERALAIETPSGWALVFFFPGFVFGFCAIAAFAVEAHGMLLLFLVLMAVSWTISGTASNVMLLDPHSESILQQTNVLRYSSVKVIASFDEIALVVVGCTGGEGKAGVTWSYGTLLYKRDGSSLGLVDGELSECARVGSQASEMIGCPCVGPFEQRDVRVEKLDRKRWRVRVYMYSAKTWIEVISEGKTIAV